MADVVIVGGGVIGASVAYHLAVHGCRDVVVLDRAAKASEGSTGRATGGLRAQFATPINIHLSRLARQLLLRFQADTGVNPGFRQHGYLFVARSPETLSALLAAREVQRETGLVESEVLTSEGVRRLNPALRPNDIVGGVFGPRDGFIEPLRILAGYRKAATGLGVRFEYGRECVGFDRSGDRLTAVVTGSGRIESGIVVNAAGAWAGEVGGMAGVRVPVTPLRRQVAATRPFAGLPEDMPMAIFADDGFHLRVREGRVLLLWPHGPAPAEPFDTTVDPEWFEAVVRIARERIPILSRAEIRLEDAWAGLYEMSPDWHALLGRAPGLENFYLVNGSSGHGVMHAPALGLLLAEMIVDGHAKSLDVRPLRPERFEEGEPNAASDLL